MDTDELRSLAQAARHCAAAMDSIGNDAKRRVNQTQLNTKDDKTLARADPGPTADKLNQDLDKISDRYTARSQAYEVRADQIEYAQRVPWHPWLPPIVLYRPRPALLAPILPPGNHWSPVLPRPHWGFPALPRIDWLPVPRTASIIERGVGLLKRGLEWLRNTFRDVTRRIVDTVAGAWRRIWAANKAMLKAVVKGLSTVVSTSVRIAVDGVTSVVSSVGRFIVSAPGAIWGFLGRKWGSFKHFFERFKLIADIMEAASGLLNLSTIRAVFGKAAGLGHILARFGKFLGAAAIVIGGVAALVNLYRYGVLDARFWESIVSLAGGLLASIAVSTMFAGAAPFAVLAAAGAAAFGLGMLMGNLIGNWTSPAVVGNAGGGAAVQVPTVRTGSGWSDMPRGITDRLRRLAEEATAAADKVLRDTLERLGTGEMKNSRRSWQDADEIYRLEWAKHELPWDAGPEGPNSYQCVSWVRFRVLELGGDQGPSQWGDGQNVARTLRDHFGVDDGDPEHAIPRPGAVISIAPNHVVFVEEVTRVGDSLKIRVSEMNTFGGEDVDDAKPVEFKSFNTFTLVEGVWRNQWGGERDFTVFNPTYPDPGS